MQVGVEWSEILRLLTMYLDTVTYSTMTLAIMRNGLPVFPISPRNSAIALAHLLKKAEVHHVLVGHEPAMQKLVASAFKILKENNEPLPTVSPMPAFEDLYPSETDHAWEPLPPSEKADPADPAIIIHSSGMIDSAIYMVHV